MKAKQLLLAGLITLCSSIQFNSPLFAQQVISGSFTSNGQTRSYLGALPTNPQSSLRLVILFCGVGENASQMVLRGYNNYLGSNSMVIYPEPSSQMGFDNVNGVDDFQMVQDLIHTIDSMYTIDTSDICIGGFSNGGIFSYKLACDFNAPTANRAYRFKAIAVVSGAMESGATNSTDCPILNTLPLIAFHGTQDPVIQFNGGPIQPPVSIVAEATLTTVGFWANAINGCSSNPTVSNLPDVVTESPNPSTVELLQYNCTSATPSRFYRIIGGRHAWPSGNANIDNVQSRNMDINASDLIAQFFESAPISSTTGRILNAASVSVFPNPVHDFFMIETSHTLKKIEIYNITGKQVYDQVEPDFQVSTADLSPGIYFLRIDTDAGTIVKKIVRQ